MTMQFEQNNDRPFTRLYNQIFSGQGAPGNGFHQPDAAGSRGCRDALPGLPVPRARYTPGAPASTAADPAQSNQAQRTAGFGGDDRGSTPIIKPLAAGTDWEACMKNIENARLESLLALNAKPVACHGTFWGTAI